MSKTRLLTGQIQASAKHHMEASGYDDEKSKIRELAQRTFNGLKPNIHHLVVKKLLYSLRDSERLLASVDFGSDTLFIEGVVKAHTVH